MFLSVSDPYWISLLFSYRLKDWSTWQAIESNLNQHECPEERCRSPQTRSIQLVTVAVFVLRMVKTMFKVASLCRWRLQSTDRILRFCQLIVNVIPIYREEDNWSHWKQEKEKKQNQLLLPYILDCCAVKICQKTDPNGVPGSASKSCKTQNKGRKVKCDAKYQHRIVFIVPPCQTVQQSFSRTYNKKIKHTLFL